MMNSSMARRRYSFCIGGTAFVETVSSGLMQTMDQLLRCSIAGRTQPLNNERSNRRVRLTSAHAKTALPRESEVIRETETYGVLRSIACVSNLNPMLYQHPAQSVLWLIRRGMGGRPARAMSATSSGTNATPM